MRRILALSLIGAGTALAASFGARLGPGQLAWRLDLADGGAGLEPLAPAARLADWAQVGLWGWLVGIALVVVGAVLARREHGRAHVIDGEGPGGALDVTAAIDRVRDEIARLRDLLDRLADEATAAELRERLDRLALEVIAPVVAAREGFVARHGLVVFASWFGPLSEGERKLARCWSALTDGHEGAAREALDEAEAAFAEALAAWQRAEGGGTTEAA